MTPLPTAEDGDPHDCMAETDSIKLVAVRPDLSNTQLEENYLILFDDGSSKKNPDGTKSIGYAVVTLTETLKGEPLPKHYSAQAAELVALTEDCKLSRGKRVTIHTHSACASSVVHVFAAEWKMKIW